MTKQEFIDQYFTRSGFTDEDKESWLKKMEVQQCNCDEPECQGWGWFTIGVKQKVNILAASENDNRKSINVVIPNGWKPCIVDGPPSTFHFHNLKVMPPGDGKEHIFFDNEGCPNEVKLDMDQPGTKEVVWSGEMPTEVIWCNVQRGYTKFKKIRLKKPPKRPTHRQRRLTKYKWGQ